MPVLEGGVIRWSRWRRWLDGLDVVDEADEEVGLELEGLVEVEGGKRPWRPAEGGVGVDDAVGGIAGVGDDVLEGGAAEGLNGERGRGCGRADVASRYMMSPTW